MISLNKKGMGIGQVFMFIIVILTFGVIMIFGYKAISDFLESGEQVSFVQFKNSLEGDIKRIYTEFNSVREVKYKLPGKYTQICFVDMDFADAVGKMDELCQLDVVACSVWEDALQARQSNPSRLNPGYLSVDSNVFLQPDALKIKVHTIKAADAQGNEQGFYCAPITRGSITLRLEGKGSYTLISPAPEQG